MPHDTLLTRIEVTSRTVRRGDVINIGGRPLRITDLVALSGGAKRLYFHTGEALAIHTNTLLTALRPQPPATSPLVRRPTWPATSPTNPHPRDGRRPGRTQER